MAKKPSKPVVKKEVNKSSQSNRKIKNIIKMEKIKNPECDKIMTDATNFFQNGDSTEVVRNKLIDKYSLTKSNANNFIKRSRKKLNIYNYGDVPKNIAEERRSILNTCIENTIKNCPTLSRFFKSENKTNKNTKKGK